MPPKIKEPVRDLEMAGFVNRGGKGSHRNYEHPNGIRITISGHLPDDAKTYQIRETKNKDCGVKIMRESDLYIKIVEWSVEDGCFIGSCPGIIDACCHGDDEIQVYTELCQIVNEWIETLKKDEKPLPSPTLSRNLASKLLNVA